jgi:hypothetical protein
MRRGTAVTPGTFATAGNAVKTLSHWTDGTWKAEHPPA